MRLRARLRAMLRGRGGLLAAAALLGVVASALPPLPRAGAAFEHVAVFDITQSMDVADQTVDGKPASRLHYAQRALVSGLRQLPCGSKLGIGVFAKRRTLLLLSPVEVCANRFELTQAIEQINGRMGWEQGSQVARGLFSAIAATAELPQRASLLFFTDGHEAPPLDEDDLASFEKPAQRVPGALIGIGGTTPMPIPRTDRDGRAAGWWGADMVQQRPGVAASMEQLSSLQEAHITELARLTGLGYVRLDTPRLLRRALTDPALAHEQVVATDMRWLPALLAGLLLLAFYLPAPRRIAWPARRAAPAAA